MQHATAYSERFFDETDVTARRSAAQIVPLIFELVPLRSVVDVGCGTRAWLAAFQERGATTLLGIDGTFAETGRADDGIEFIFQDLSTPIEINRTFDLASCLEVAEHLPAAAADVLVDSLCRLSDLVLFSAAIPFQGGVDHVNEQWPDYWVEKFNARGYVPIDCLRERIWNNEEVAYWYAQNLLLFAKRSCLWANSKLELAAQQTNPRYLTRIHPKAYLKSREKLASFSYKISRLLWNSAPKPIRVWVLKHFGQKFWQHVNTTYR